MEKLLNHGDYSPILEEDYLLPTQGSYHAVVTDVEMREILPIGQDIEFCLIVRFRLVNTETYDVYYFTETFLPYEQSPRSKDFLAFLNHNGYSFTCYEEIVGLRANVEVVYTSLGDYIHPEISFRDWGISQLLQDCPEEFLPF